MKLNYGFYLKLGYSFTSLGLFYVFVVQPKLEMDSFSETIPKTDAPPEVVAQSFVRYLTKHDGKIEQFRQPASDGVVVETDPVYFAKKIDALEDRVIGTDVDLLAHDEIANEISVRLSHLDEGQVKERIALLDSLRSLGGIAPTETVKSEILKQIDIFQTQSQQVNPLNETGEASLEIKGFQIASQYYFALETDKVRRDAVYEKLFHPGGINVSVN